MTKTPTPQTTDYARRQAARPDFEFRELGRPTKRDAIILRAPVTPASIGTAFVAYGLSYAEAAELYFQLHQLLWSDIDLSLFPEAPPVS